MRGKMSDIAMRRSKATACMKHSFQSGIKERICISKKTGSKAKVNTSQQPYFFGLIHRYWLNLVLEKKYSRLAGKYSRSRSTVFSWKMRWSPPENTVEYFPGDSIYTTEIKSPNFEAVPRHAEFSNRRILSGSSPRHCTLFQK